MALKAFFHQNSTYNAEDLRVLAQAMLPSSGVFTGTDLVVTTPGSNTVSIAAGRGVCTHALGTTGTGGSRFIVSNSLAQLASNYDGGGSPTVWSPYSGGNAGAPRVDNVFLKVTDYALEVQTDSLGAFFDYGTEGSLTPPSLPSNSAILLLATITSFGGGNITVTDRRRIIGQVSEPAGVVKSYAGTGAPAGYLPCDGSSVSRTVYADLFAAIGTQWGSADASTFKLPDFRGRTLLGAGTGPGLTARTFATTGGTETHTLTEDQMPSHRHQLDYYGAQGGVPAQAGANTGSEAYTWTGQYTGYTGGAQAHPIMQPWAAVNYVISY